MFLRLKYIGSTVLLTLAAQLLLVKPAYACSAELDFNPVAEAEVIVGGRITAWERLPTEAGAPFTPIQLTMTVDQRLKGSVGATLQFVDHTSLSQSNAGEVWVGSSGACGVFDSDPAGQYMVLGLDTAPNGRYLSNLMLLFFRGSEPAGDVYSQALSRLNDFAQRLTPTAALTEPPMTIPSATVAPPPPTPEPSTPPAPEASPIAATSANAREAEPAIPAIPILVLGIGVVAGGLVVLALRRRDMS